MRRIDFLNINWGDVIFYAVMTLICLAMIFFLGLAITAAVIRDNANTDQVVYECIEDDLDNAKSSAIRHKDKERFEFWDNIDTMIMERIAKSSFEQ